MLADQYIQAVTDSLSSLFDHTEEIRQAAEKTAQTVLDGHNVFLFDNHGIVDSELYERASGLALFRNLYKSTVKPSQGDIIIISSLTAEDEASMRLSEEARAAGVYTIVIAPPGNLADNADLALKVTTEDDNGVIELSGIGKPFCPISGILNVATAWSIVAETAARLMADGKVPTVLWGKHLKDGDRKFNEARKRFTAEGY